MEEKLTELLNILNNISEEEYNKNSTYYDNLITEIEDLELSKFFENASEDRVEDLKYMLYKFIDPDCVDAWTEDKVKRYSEEIK